MEKLKYSRDGKVFFREDDHSYWKGDKKLISTTQLINKYSQPFDKDEISKRVAKKKNKTQKEVLDMWSKKANEAAEKGTSLHYIFEHYTNTGQIIKYDRWKKESDVCERFINDFFKTSRLTPKYTEEIVYSDKIAGQIDLVAEDPLGRYHIIDFKTNEKITDDNFGQMMLDPFYMIPQSKLHKFSLQTYIYKLLFEDNFRETIFSRLILHITDRGYRFIEPKILSVMDYELEELIF